MTALVTSRTRGRVVRGNAVLALTVLTLLAGWAVPTEAAVPRVSVSAIRALPEPRLVVPRPTTTGLDKFRSSGRYGLADESTIAELDNAARRLDDDISATADKVRANADAQSAFKECTGNGLQEAGMSYAEALRDAAFAGDAIPAPSFQQAIDGTAACLNGYIAEAPDDMLEMGANLTSLSVERAQEAHNAGQSGAALAKWMTTTGQGLSEAELTPGESVIDEVQPSAPTGAQPAEEFPLWAAIAVLIVLGGGAAAVRSMKS